MIFSASSVQAKAEQGSSVHFLRSQVMYVALGTVALIFGINFNYKNYKKFFVFIQALNITLLLITFLFPPVNEARRWIRIGPFSFQTSEFAKFAVIVGTAYFLDLYRKEISKFRFLIFPLMLMVVSVGIIFIQPSFSASMTIAMTCFITLFIGGMNMIHVLALMITRSLPYRQVECLVLVLVRVLKSIFIFLNLKMTLYLQL